MEIGSVFRWDEYPKQREGELKVRWFIYLGLSSILSEPQNVFLLPSTTQLELYGRGKRRQNHKKIKIFGKGYCGFEKKSIVDIYFFENNWPLQEFNSFKRKMIVRGRLPNDDLKQLYELISTDYYIERIVIIDIRRNLNGIGIYNLKMPN